MTLLRDVIDIPEAVSASDFVVGLADSVEHRERTLSTYVVTPQLATCFDKALEAVALSVDDGRSRAAFLHGSFGSGKSHFMSVLYQVLRRDPDARSIEELAPVIAKHDAALADVKVLTLTYHLIGATSLEEAILKGYVTQIRREHPNVALPAVHRSDDLLANADLRRQQDGDERFFDTLNGGTATAPASGFGGMGGGASTSTWDAVRYEAARAMPEGEVDRTALVNVLVSTMFPAFGSHSDYVDLDTGLSAIAQHAEGLGYGAVVLFLDELILWLASHLQNREFVTSEGAKLAKLVESQDAARAVPLVSLISRQRDIAEFLGNHVPGAERAAFNDVFSWSRGRFDDIRLEDRNLPVIVERRLLRPKNAAAKAQIDEAFNQLGASESAMDVLLTGQQVDDDGTGSDKASFRRTYPFSPALVSTLVSLSQALQRERTALRVMLQLLVNNREELQVGDLVPVGDLFDVVVDTDVQAVTPELGHKFQLARRLYHNKLRRALLDLHQLTEEQASQVEASHQFRVDDRLVKTLIISALAPEVPALASLTAGRLSALNHGTIKTFFQGQEVALALQKMRAVAAQVSEVTVGDGDDPFITVDLIDVDPDVVLERVRNVDNEGNRRRLLKELIWESLQIKEQETFDATQSVVQVWRGKRVDVDLVFGNVRDPAELPEATLVAEGGRWRVVVDYPFDAADQSPLSDKSRVDEIASKGVESQTLFWVPAFLTQPRLEDLGTLVALNHLFAGDGTRFREAADDMAAADREQVRNQLTQRRTQLRARLLDCLKQAYGAAAPADTDVDTATALDLPFLTLASGFIPQAPVGATLADALKHLLDQAFTFSWPDHPRFEPGSSEIRPADARKVLELVMDAVAAPGGRLAVEQAQRGLVARVVGPLELGLMSEGNTHLVVSAASFPWLQRLTQRAAADGQQSTFSVGSLLSYLDQPNSRGLAPHVAGLVVHTLALLEDLAWWRDGQQIESPPVERTGAALELRSPELPEESTWTAGLFTARELFGVQVADLRSAANMGRLVTAVRQAATRDVEKSRDLVRVLEQHSDDLAIVKDADRVRTATELSDLLGSLTSEVDDLRVVELLAGASWTTTVAAARRSLDTAAAIKTALVGEDWEAIRALRQIVDQRKDEATTILAKLADTAGRDELAAALIPVLDATRTEARQLLVVTPEPTPHPKPQATSVTTSVDAVDAVLADLAKQIRDSGESAVTIWWAPSDE